MTKEKAIQFLMHQAEYWDKEAKITKEDMTYWWEDLSYYEAALFNAENNRQIIKLLEDAV